MEIDTFNNKPQNEPNKLVLSSDKLSTYIKDPSSLQTPPTKERTEWENCCDFLDYDYNLNVMDIISKTNWTMKSLVFKQYSSCYPDRPVGIAEMPVVISYPGGRKNPGIATLNLSRTSLSELSFWLSQAFARASTQPGYGDAFPDADQLYQVTVRLDSEITDVVIDQNKHRVCVGIPRLFDPETETYRPKLYCKSFAYLPNIGLNVKGWYAQGNPCRDVVISSSYGSVNVTYM
jgi:hypothetical protein